MTPLIELESVSKYFGSVIALNDVSFDVRAGEVHCLLGDNGAGKSTLIKILSGVHTPDAGEILVDGEPARFGSPKETLDHGIATVYQDLALVPLMSVARNFFLGREPREARRARSASSTSTTPTATAYRELRRDGHRAPRCRAAGRHAVGRRAPVPRHRARHPFRRQGADPRRADLGAGRAPGLGRAASSSSQSKARGIGVIFISHNVHHAYVVGDRFTILKRGKSVGTYREGATSAATSC